MDSTSVYETENGGSSPPRPTIEQHFAQEIVRLAEDALKKKKHNKRAKKALKELIKVYKKRIKEYENVHPNP